MRFRRAGYDPRYDPDLGYCIEDPEMPNLKQAEKEAARRSKAGTPMPVPPDPPPVTDQDARREAEDRARLVREHFYPDCNCDFCFFLRFLDEARLRAAPATTDDLGRPRSEWAAENMRREREAEADNEVIRKLEQHFAAPDQDASREAEIRERLTSASRAGSFADWEDVTFLLRRLDEVREDLRQTRAALRQEKDEVARLRALAPPAKEPQG